VAGFGGGVVYGAPWTFRLQDSLIGADGAALISRPSSSTA
jgi:hypothetical protein